MEEIKPDPVYLEDDDPADMSDEEKNYKGYDWDLNCIRVYCFDNCFIY